MSLCRSAGRVGCRSRRKFRGHLLESGQSLVAFAFGLLLASLYGITALLVQKQPLWLGVYTTLAVAVLASFGMGLSTSVRADVMVLLPSLCSGRSVMFGTHLSGLKQSSFFSDRHCFSLFCINRLWGRFKRENSLLL